MFLTHRSIAILPVVVAALAVSGCSRSPQVRGAQSLEEGKKELQRKEYARAIIHFRNAAQAMPRDAEPYYQLGLAFLATEDIAIAASCFHKAAELNPQHKGAQLKLAEMMSMSASKEMLDEAQKRSQQVLKLQPGDADALNVLALTELRLGKPENAEAHLEQALQNSPNHMKSSVNLAKARLMKRDVKGAEEVLKQSAAQAPASPDPAVYLGKFYEAVGRTTDAEQQLRRALQVDPKHGPALLALGAMQVRAGQQQQADETYKQLAALPEKRYKAIHALFLFQSGKRDEAVAEFEEIARVDPNDRDLRTLLVRVYLAVDRVADAEAILTSALRKNPRDLDALLLRSRIYISSAKYAEAQADLNQVLSFRKSVEAHYLLAKVHQARGDAANQRQELGDALRVFPGYIPARIELAQTLIASNGAQSALKILDEAPPDQRGTVQVLVQRNWALLSLGEKAEARKGIDQALALARVPDAVLQDAVARLDQKDYVGARSSADEVLKQNPENTRALKVLLQSYAAQKQAPAALRLLREHVARLPRSAVLQQFLGEVLLAMGNRMEARKAFEAAKANNSRGVSADLSLAGMDVAEGKLDRASETLSRVISADPNNIRARLLLADVAITRGETSAAIEQYHKILDIDQRELTALNNLAYLLAENGRSDEALRYAQQAKEIAPDSAIVDDTLGWTYFRKGMYTSAVAHLESAAAKKATARRKYHLAMAYLKAGSRQRGQQVLEAALEMNASLPEAAAARRLFDGIAE